MGSGASTASVSTWWLAASANGSASAVSAKAGLSQIGSEAGFTLLLGCVFLFSFQEQEPPSHPCLQVQQHVSGVLFAFSFVGPPTSARQLHPRGFANILEDQQNVEQKTDGHLLSVMPKDMPPSELCEADANETQ